VALPKTQGARQAKTTSGNARQKSKADVLADAGVTVREANRRECCDKCPFEVTKDYESGKDIFSRLAVARTGRIISWEEN